VFWFTHHHMMPTHIPMQLWHNNNIYYFIDGKLLLLIVILLRS